MPLRIAQWQQPLRRTLVQTSPTRTFVSAQRLRLKEDADRGPEEIEAAKQEQLKTGKRKGELESQSEAAVGADQQKVDDHGKHMEDLQKQTANQKQSEHPAGKS